MLLSLKTSMAAAISPISSARPTAGMVMVLSPPDSRRMAPVMACSGRETPPTTMRKPKARTPAAARPSAPISRWNILAAAAAWSPSSRAAVICRLTRALTLSVTGSMAGYISVPVKASRPAWSWALSRPCSLVTAASAPVMAAVTPWARVFSSGVMLVWA